MRRFFNRLFNRPARVASIDEGWAAIVRREERACRLERIIFGRGGVR